MNLSPQSLGCAADLELGVGSELGGQRNFI